MPKLKTMRDIGAGLTDKVDHHRYDRVYPTFLERFRNLPITLAEIGVENGGSLHMWAQYLPKATIIGVDIEPPELDLPERVSVIQGDQSSLEGIHAMSAALPVCDVIIDDGSHIPAHQHATFVELFRANLKPGGVYIIEDIETSWWRPDAYMYGYEIGTDSAFRLGLHLAGAVNQEFSRIPNDFGVESVTFGPNCIVLTKSLTEDLPLYGRPYRYLDRQ